VNRYVETVTAVFETARKTLKWIGVNPVRDMSDLAENNIRVRWLSNKERENLLAQCGVVGDVLHDLVVAGLCTGARAGELLSLRWPVVDLKEGVAYLNTNETKNKDGRAMPLPEPLLGLLKLRKKIRRIDTDLVFPDPVNNRQGKPRRFDYHKKYVAAVKRAGITNFKFHDLRHTTASWLIMNGATLPVIGHVLGHKSAASTIRYAHLEVAYKASVVDDMIGKRLRGGA